MVVGLRLFSGKEDDGHGDASAHLCHRASLGHALMPSRGLQREHLAITRWLIGLGCIGRRVATLRRPWQDRSVALPRFDDVLDRLENLHVGPAAADIAVEVAANLLSG